MSCTISNICTYVFSGTVILVTAITAHVLVIDHVLEIAMMTAAVPGIVLVVAPPLLGK